MHVRYTCNMFSSLLTYSYICMLPECIIVSQLICSGTYEIKGFWFFQFCLNNSLYLLWSFNMVLVLNSLSFHVRYYLCVDSFYANIDCAAICWLLLEPYMFALNRFLWHLFYSVVFLGSFCLVRLVSSAIVYYFPLDVSSENYFYFIRRFKMVYLVSIFSFSF